MREKDREKNNVILAYYCGSNAVCIQESTEIQIEMKTKDLQTNQKSQEYKSGRVTLT